MLYYIYMQLLNALTSDVVYCIVCKTLEWHLFIRKCVLRVRVYITQERNMQDNVNIIRRRNVFHFDARVLDFVHHIVRLWLLNVYIQQLYSTSAAVCIVFVKTENYPRSLYKGIIHVHVYAVVVYSVSLYNTPRRLFAIDKRNSTLSLSLSLSPHVCAMLYTLCEQVHRYITCHQLSLYILRGG